MKLPLIKIEPLSLLIEDRKCAKYDVNADFFYLATNCGNDIGVRTLLFKEITNKGIKVIIQKDSQKYIHLCGSGEYEILIWWATTGIQYRIKGSFEFLSSDETYQIWLKTQPEDGKLLDILKSSMIALDDEIDKDKILELLEKLKVKVDFSILPNNVVGIIFIPLFVERMHVSYNSRIHERIIFNKNSSGQWESRSILP